VIDEPREPDVWTIGALAFAGLLALLVVMLSGCTSEQAVTAANVQHAVGEEAAAILHERCTVPYEQAQTVAEVEALDAKGCPEAARSLRTYREAHALVVATMLAIDAGRCTSRVSQAPRECDLTGHGFAVVRAAADLARSLKQIRGER
jgi:hypothetical protein